MQFIPEQENFFNVIKTTKHKVKFDCAPGTGKTFAVNTMAEELIKRGEFVFLTSFSKIGTAQFNVPGALIKTTNALGLAICQNHFYSANNPKRNGRFWGINTKFDKYSYILRRQYTQGYDKKSDEYKAVSKEISKMMQDGLYDLTNFARYYNCKTREDLVKIWPLVSKEDYVEEFTNLVFAALDEGIWRYQTNGSVDFTDTIWLPNVFDMQLYGFYHYIDKNEVAYYSRYGVKYTQKTKVPYIEFPHPSKITIFADEYQDCNFSEMLFLKQFVDSGSRIVLVGDQDQAIYAFRGSLNNASKVASEIFSDLHTCKISTTFRCPKSHTEYMRNKIVSFEGIAPRPLHETIVSYRDEEGELLECDLNNIVDYIIPGKTAIIGRNFNGKNSDIIPALMQILNYSDYTIRVEGVELNNGYVKRVLSVMQEHNVDRISAKEIIIFEEEQKIASDENYYVNLNDLKDELDFAVLVIGLCAGCETVSEIADFLKNYFDNPNPDVIFSTIHKAKGATYQNVIVLNANRWPYFDERNNIEANLQEINLMLVAFSRSNNRMVLCNYPNL